MPWSGKQDAELSSVDLPESNKRVLQGAIDYRVDVGAVSLNGISGTELHDKYDTGVRDLTSQRVMVLIKATGEAVSVQVWPCCMLLIADTSFCMCLCLTWPSPCTKLSDDTHTVHYRLVGWS